jgi:hypothetical protein
MATPVIVALDSGTSVVKAVAIPVPRWRAAARSMLTASTVNITLARTGRTERHEDKERA